MRVELVAGDICEASSITAALSDVNPVITTATSMSFSYVPGENDIQKEDLEGMKSLIDQSKTSGIQQFIYTSFPKQVDLDFPLRNPKREVEDHLKNGGLTYTVHRPSSFVEVWLREITSR